ncbi:MAG: hypothetical protein ACLS7V_02385 [Enterococcus durans]
MILIMLLGIGLIGILLVSVPRIRGVEGTPDGWLGYWGGVTGALLGVIGANFVMNKQLEKEKIKEKNYLIEKERPYFFIEPSDEVHLNFYFYNRNNSLVTDLNVFIKEKSEKYIKYSLGHCKSNETYSFEDKEGLLIGQGLMLYGKTLLEENFIFIYGTFSSGKSYNGGGFVYDPIKKKKISKYFGEDIEQKEFEELLKLFNSTDYINYPIMGKSFEKFNNSSNSST